MEASNRSLHKWHLHKLHSYLLFCICLSVRTFLCRMQICRQFALCFVYSWLNSVHFNLLCVLICDEDECYSADRSISLCKSRGGRIKCPTFLYAKYTGDHNYYSFAFKCRYGHVRYFIFVIHLSLLSLSENSGRLTRVRLRIWGWMFLVNRAAVWSSSLDPHSLSRKSAPDGHRRVLSSVWVGQFCRVCSASRYENLVGKEKSEYKC